MGLNFFFWSGRTVIISGAAENPSGMSSAVHKRCDFSAAASFWCGSFFLQQLLDLALTSRNNHVIL